METITGQIIQAKKIGSIQLHTIIKNKLEKIKFINIYYYPSLDFNFISLDQLNHIKINFNIKQNIIFVNKNKIIYFKAYQTDNIYILNILWTDISTNKFNHYKIYTTKKNNNIKK